MSRKTGACLWNYDCFHCGGDDCIANEYDIRQLIKQDTAEEKQLDEERKQLAGETEEQKEELTRQIVQLRKEGFSLEYIALMLNADRVKVGDLYGAYVISENPDVPMWEQLKAAGKDVGITDMFMRRMILGLAMLEIFTEEDLYKRIEADKKITYCGITTIKAFNTFTKRKLKYRAAVHGSNFGFVGVDRRAGRKMPKRRKKNAS